MPQSQYHKLEVDWQLNANPMRCIISPFFAVADMMHLITFFA